MKKIFLFWTLGLALALPSCLRDECVSHRVFVRMDPVYSTVQALRDGGFSIAQARPLRHPGKIYSYGHYLLINEIDEGIHIIDNSDPAHPANLSFIQITGNRDMAVKENILYADNVVDLLAIDITDPLAPVLRKRLENVFQKSYGWGGAAASQPLLVGYTKSNETQVIDCAQPRFQRETFLDNSGFWVRADVLQSSGGNSAAKTNGVGGSMARFGIVDRYLYAIDQSELHVVYIDQPADPKEGKSVSISWNIETLFPYKDKLFIGAQNGMFILENKNPEAPYLLSSFSHARACDPVYVDGETAFVTLRDGNECTNYTNELDIVDISNITSPRLVKKYQMQHPHGLSVIDQILFLCEGQYGLKAFDAGNIQTIDKNLKAHLTAFHAYDVIALSRSHLIVVGEQGLIQLDASDLKNIKTRSLIPVVKD
ncbi:MAG TPA: hypothetical protein PKM27_06860 [Saprospiraceae bacterium]|nr:hypothetical protein [Saprospiraceae bacterium]HNT20567.1 hypothetical protein [Saprospiraceae bacterium]